MDVCSEFAKLNLARGAQWACGTAEHCGGTSAGIESTKTLSDDVGLAHKLCYCYGSRQAQVLLPMVFLAPRII
jgi:hypothetical protein